MEDAHLSPRLPAALTTVSMHVWVVAVDISYANFPICGATACQFAQDMWQHPSISCLFYQSIWHGITDGHAWQYAVKDFRDRNHCTVHIAVNMRPKMLWRADLTPVLHNIVYKCGTAVAVAMLCLNQHLLKSICSTVSVHLTILRTHSAHPLGATQCLLVVHVGFHRN